MSSFYENNKNIDLKTYNIIRSKQQTYVDLAFYFNNTVSYDNVKGVFLRRKESFPMETSLDMNTHFVHNVKTPEKS